MMLVRHSHSTFRTRESVAHPFWGKLELSLVTLEQRFWRLVDTQRTDVRGTRRGGHRRRAPQSMLVHALSLLSWAYVAAVVAIALVLWGLGDAWWPATLLLFIGRWIFLTPLALLLPAAVLFRRRLLAPLLLGALVALGPVMGFRLGLPRWLPHAPGTPFRVVTFNADGGYRTALDLPILIGDWKPDVIAFQECGVLLAYATTQVAGWYAHRERSLCVLSRYPIDSVSIMDRSAFERVKEDETLNVGGSADVVRYALRTPVGPVNFTNLHLETPRKGFDALVMGDVRRMKLNTELRRIESEVARRWVAQGGPPLIVAGDFNMPVESRIFQRYWGDLADAFSTAGFGLGMTKYNGWIGVRIDHVLVGRSWRVERVSIGRDAGSDHRPVIVDLTLLPQ